MTSERKGVSLDAAFLELPPRVILAVSERRGDRAMDARLADALRFYREDLQVRLAARREALGAISFQERLGTMLAKAERVERLARELGLLSLLPEPTLMAAVSGAHLAKCDLASLVVGAFPELEGEMGAVYALAQGVSPDVAEVIRSHYAPRRDGDSTAPTDSGALVAIADRLDTLVGYCGINQLPKTAADPHGLGRACRGVVRTVADRDLEFSLPDAFRAAYDGYPSGVLDVAEDDLVGRLGGFFSEIVSPKR